MKILMIEDDATLVCQLKRDLEQCGYMVDVSQDGEDGLYRLQEFEYELAIIDIGLPKLSGIEVIETARKEGITTPFLLLTARSSWRDKVSGLKCGADDYLVKPFQFEELAARIEALIRRSAGYASSLIKAGHISLDLDSQEVRVHDKPVKLTKYEYRLAHHFITNQNKIFSKLTLMDYLYDESDDPESNVIEVLVARLRNKIDPEQKYKPIETLRGRGYRFVVERN